MIKKFKRGFGIVEIVIGVAIVSLALFSLMVVAQNTLRFAQETGNLVKASFLLEEGLEALRSVRDDSWNNNIATLNAGVDHYLIFQNSKWETTDTPEQIDNLFNRKFIMEDVYRDGEDDIAETGTLDPGTKKFTVYVSWENIEGETSERRISTYLTNFFNE